MARTITSALGSLVLVAVASALTGCSGADSATLARETSDTEPTKPKSGKSDDEASQSPPPATSSTAPAAPASPAPSAPAPPPTPAAQCGATADAVSCVACCLKGMPEIDEKTCTCDAASPCQAACGTTLCSGKIPNVACGQCLLANATKIQSCVEAIALAPKKCVLDAGCLSKAGAEKLDQLPLPFDLP